jgi:hypothetical protein
MKFQFNDGGRKDAGFSGTTGDCFTRSIAIVTGKPYKEVYEAINEVASTERIGISCRSRSNSRTGVYSKTARRYMDSLGYKWIACMGIGTGCKVHLKEDELPQGRLVVRVSKHYTAVIDGVINDNHNPDRNGTRCVYGYWIKKEQA